MVSSGYSDNEQNRYCLSHVHVDNQMQTTVTCYNMIYGHSPKDRNVCPGWVMFPPYAGFQRFGILFEECYICYQQRSFSCFISRTSIPSGKRLHSYGKSQFLIGKSTINGPCSIAMLNYQRVTIV